MRETSSLDYRGTSILVALLDAPPTNASGLAATLNVSQPVISRSVKLMIEEGLVNSSKYVVCPHCGKEIESLPLATQYRVIQLTEKGKAAAEKIKEALKIMKTFGGSI